MGQLMKSGKRLIKNFPKQSTVYWFDPEPVKGAEIRKVRPCIVVSPNEMNEYLQTVIVVPLTSTIFNWPFRISLEVLGHKSSAACDQIRVIDKARLKSQIASLKPNDNERLLGMLQTMFSK